MAHGPAMTAPLGWPGPERSMPCPSLEVTFRRLGCRSMVGTLPACLNAMGRLKTAIFEWL